MRKRFFLKNLSFFIVLLLIPIIIMGTFSIQMVKNYIKKDIEQDNILLLNQIRENMDLIIGELKPYELSLGLDGGNSFYIKKMLNSQTLDFTDISNLKIIMNNLSSLSDAREYIDSIYIYFENDGKYFMTDKGKLRLHSVRDQGWYDSFLQNREKIHWSERRTIQDVGDTKKEVISLYHVLGNKKNVIVFNLVPEYFAKMDGQINSSNGRQVIIVNSEEKVLFNNSDGFEVGFAKVWDEVENIENSKVVFINEKDKSYIAQKIVAKTNGWNYILISDAREVYTLYYRLNLLIIVFITISIFAGTILALIFTRNSTKKIYEIIDIFQAAENGAKIPRLTHATKDTYTYIVENIIKTFINQSYLKNQLELRKYKLELAQMSALQMQVNSHFIYNTLDTINWKVYQLTHEANEANDMIGYLSDILYYSLEKPEEKVHLWEEIDNVKNYISILQIRYKDKFEVHWEVDEEVVDRLVPKILLQPLVENSIYHGIKPMNGKGRIDIYIAKSIQGTRISIADNGQGIDKNKLEEIKKTIKKSSEIKSGSIGLHNINSRLVLADCPELEIDSNGSGTTIILTVKEEDNVSIINR